MDRLEWNKTCPPLWSFFFFSRTSRGIHGDHTTTGAGSPNNNPPVIFFFFLVSSSPAPFLPLLRLWVHLHPLVLEARAWDSWETKNKIKFLRHTTRFRPVGFQTTLFFSLPILTELSVVLSHTITSYIITSWISHSPYREREINVPLMIPLSLSSLLEIVTRTSRLLPRPFFLLFLFLVVVDSFLELPPAESARSSLLWLGLVYIACRWLGVLDVPRSVSKAPPSISPHLFDLVILSSVWWSLGWKRFIYFHHLENRDSVDRPVCRQLCAWINIEKVGLLPSTVKLQKGQQFYNMILDGSKEFSIGKRMRAWSLRSFGRKKGDFSQLIPLGLCSHRDIYI